MRFRPANISLINRRLYLPRLLLTLSSIEKDDHRIVTGHYISMSVLPTTRQLRVQQAERLLATIVNASCFPEPSRCRVLGVGRTHPDR